jgi:spermidine/putrescine transport system permease protein
LATKKCVGVGAMKLRQQFSELIPFTLGVPALLWQFFFFWLPLFFVVLLSFKSGTFESFRPFFAYSYIIVIARTLLFAFANAFFCLLIAYPVTYWIAFNGGRWKDALLALLIIPFWNTYLLHVYAWMFVLERGGALNVLLQKIGLICEPIHFLNTPFAILLVMVYSNLPFMFLPLYTALEKFDVRLFEASYDLGATWWQTFWHVVVPITYPGIRAGFFLVLVIAFGEFAIPELIGGDKLLFVGSIIAQYTIGAHTASMGAAFTLITSLILLAVIIVIYFVMRRFYRQ